MEDIANFLKIQVVEVFGSGCDERREYSFFTNWEDAEDYVVEKYGCTDPDNVFYIER